MDKPTTTIRGLDRELWVEARARAVRARKPIYQWLNEAIKEKLDREKPK